MIDIVSESEIDEQLASISELNWGKTIELLIQFIERIDFKKLDKHLFVDFKVHWHPVPSEIDSDYINYLEDVINRIRYLGSDSKNQDKLIQMIKQIIKEKDSHDN